ncbi:uncharacterized protein LOC125233623 isoform X2 [Leguminivora glycinivorella]|uniref:uncharacterized protein LOC125233623 isoform X2 n=1 Tax=Leguminivora glycinivorella TaxID=1035111 RepID=UPI00200FA05A|nr:uncharacterized protein LOC125233623 isoform X2 [Leguminivora glycinivorella]
MERKHEPLRNIWSRGSESGLLILAQHFLKLTSKQVMKKIERTRASRCQGRPYYQKLPQTPKNEREVTCPARHADVTSRHHAGRAIARAVAGAPEHEAASLSRRA